MARERRRPSDRTAIRGQGSDYRGRRLQRRGRRRGRPEIDWLFVQVDVTDEAQVNNLFDTAAETSGSVDIAFNNAGISPPDDD